MGTSRLALWGGEVQAGLSAPSQGIHLGKEAVIS